MNSERQLNEILNNYSFNSNQIAIIKGILRGQSYYEIGQPFGSNKDSVKTMASRIFKKISKVDNSSEPINKKNLRDHLEAKQKFFLENRIKRLENPRGEVPLDSHFYVERFQEKWLIEQLLIAKEPIKIEGGRREGKSSLAMRIKEQALKFGNTVVDLNFRFDLNHEPIRTYDEFLKWFCSTIASRLGFPNSLDEYWDEELGGQVSSGIYFEDYLLPRIEKDLVLSLDRLECIDNKYVENFIVCLRAWHSKGRISRDSLFQKLRLILIYSRDIPGICPALSSTHNSSFNFGAAIKLNGFTLDEVKELGSLHQINWNDLEIEKLIAQIGSNPYLVREAFYQIVKYNLSLDEFLKSDCQTKQFKEIVNNHLTSEELSEEELNF